MHRTVTTVTPGRRSGLREFGSTCRVDATGVLYITPTLTKSPGARAPGARCRAGLMVYSSNQCELYICQFERMRVKTVGVFLSRVRQQHSLFPPLLPLPFRHRKITAVFRLLDWCRCAVALTPRRSMQRLWCRLWVMVESDLTHYGAGYGSWSNLTCPILSSDSPALTHRLQRSTATFTHLCFAHKTASGCKPHIIMWSS